MAKIEILDCEQGTPEWLQARMGMPTASMFGAVMAKGEGKTRRSYMLKLAGEIITGEPVETYSNDDMERGKVAEPELLERYIFQTEAKVRRVGFVRNGTKGWSPDGLIGDDGALEIKSAAPHMLLEILDSGQPPTKHTPQCQGGLWVGERKWIDLVIGSTSKKLPLFIYRHHRNDIYIKNVSSEVASFNVDLRAFVERIRSM